MWSVRLHSCKALPRNLGFSHDHFSFPTIYSRLQWEAITVRIGVLSSSAQIRSWNILVLLWSRLIFQTFTDNKNTQMTVATNKMWLVEFVTCTYVFMDKTWKRYTVYIYSWECRQSLVQHTPMQFRVNIFFYAASVTDRNVWKKCQDLTPVNNPLYIVTTAALHPFCHSDATKSTEKKNDGPQRHSFLSRNELKKYYLQSHKRLS